MSFNDNRVIRLQARLAKAQTKQELRNAKKQNAAVQDMSLKKKQAAINAMQSIQEPAVKITNNGMTEATALNPIPASSLTAAQQSMNQSQSVVPPVNQSNQTRNANQAMSGYLTAVNQMNAQQEKTNQPQTIQQ